MNHSVNKIEPCSSLTQELIQDYYEGGGYCCGGMWSHLTQKVALFLKVQPPAQKYDKQSAKGGWLATLSTPPPGSAPVTLFSMSINIT